MAPTDVIQSVAALDIATDAEVIAGVAQYFENLAASDAYPDRPRPKFRRRLALRLREIVGRVAVSPDHYEAKRINAVAEYAKRVARIPVSPTSSEGR